MIKGNIMAWDVTKLRPIPPHQIFHHVNEKNVCVTKKCEYAFSILAIMPFKYLYNIILNMFRNLVFLL